ncbi:MAG: glycosyltransferase, partial [Marinilabiliales bacterium]
MIKFVKKQIVNPEISIVVPLFNEEKNLPKLVEEVKGVLLSLSVSFEIVLVDDGSRDASFEIVKELANLNQEVQGISLSRNFGHQTALLAGLEHSRGNLVITMDADLQHPPSLIPQLIEKQKEGYDIVNTKCNSVEGAGFLKTFSSGLYYKIVNLLSDVHIEPGSADFRLMTRRVVDHFTSIPER